MRDRIDVIDAVQLTGRVSRLGGRCGIGSSSELKY